MSFDCPLAAKRLAQQLANSDGQTKIVVGFWLQEIGIHQYAVIADGSLHTDSKCFTVWVIYPD